MTRFTGVGLFLALFVIAGSWALATPPYAAPDEPAHVYRAAAVVRGQLLPPTSDQPAGGLAVQRVPQGFIEPAEEIFCFIRFSERTADCAQDTAADGRLVPVDSGAARYNPVYYAAVGWPSLVAPSVTGLYLIRLVSAALCAAFLAWGLLSALQWRRSRLLAVGAGVALTPMSLFLAGVVNPSGLEIATAFCLWTAGLVLVTEGDEENTSTLLRRMGVAAAVLVVTRGLAPLWLALIVVTLVAIARPPMITRLLRRRDFWLWAGVAVGSSVFSVLWTVLSGSSQIPDQNPNDLGFLAAARTVLLFMPRRLEEFVGYFGWIDTPSPTYSLALWPMLLGLVVLLGLAAGSRRHCLVLGALIATVVVLPIGLEAVQYNNLGLFWQARYTVPLALGIPILAGLLAGEYGERLRGIGRLQLLVLSLLGTVHFVSFVWALRRYQVGTDGSLNPLKGDWHPPVGSLTVLVLQLIGLVGLAVVMQRARRDEHQPVG